jgi:IS5 family transposase
MRDSVPDETTHCRFRNALVKGGVYDDLLAEVCRQLEGHGLKLKAAQAAIIDATLIESAAPPRNHIDPPQDRAEDEAPDVPDVHFSADPDARWVKKGSKSTLGFKGFARADEEGYIDRVHTTPANKAESPEFDTMVDGAKAQRILADKAYASRANREAIKGKHRDGVRLFSRTNGAHRLTAKSGSWPPAARVREALQQADLETQISRRAVLWDHETPVRPAPRPLFRVGQNPRPNGDGGDRAEPASRQRLRANLHVEGGSRWANGNGDQVCVCGLCIGATVPACWSRRGC